MFLSCVLWLVFLHVTRLAFFALLRRVKSVLVCFLWRRLLEEMRTLHANVNTSLYERQCHTLSLQLSFYKEVEISVYFLFQWLTLRRVCVCGGTWLHVKKIKRTPRYWNYLKHWHLICAPWLNRKSISSRFYQIWQPRQCRQVDSQLTCLSRPPETDRNTKFEPSPPRQRKMVLSKLGLLQKTGACCTFGRASACRADRSLS